MTTPAAERQRLYRERERAGVWVVPIEVGPDLIDALERAGFGADHGGFGPLSIETREDAAEAITAALLRWKLLRNQPLPTSNVAVTNNGDADELVVDHESKGRRT